jgi:hypothetical protein
MQDFKPVMAELNSYAQRCLTRYFTGDFASWTVHFVNICVKNQQMQQLFIQFINYVWLLLHAHHVTRHNTPRMASIQVVFELVNSRIYLKIAGQSAANFMNCIGVKQRYNL